MQRSTSTWIFGITVVLLVAVTFATTHWSAAQVSADSQSQDTEESSLDDDLEGDEFLEVEGFEEEIEDHLALADEDEEGFEGDLEELSEHELEDHHRHFEMEMVEMETNFARLEMVGKISKIASEELLSAAFAITHVTEFMEEEDVIAFLNDALEGARDEGVRRLIRIKLAEAYAHADQPEKAKQQLRALIVEN